MAEQSESATQRALRLAREAEAAKGDAIQELLAQRVEIESQLRELGWQDESAGAAPVRRRRRTKAEMAAANGTTARSSSSEQPVKRRGRPKKNAGAG